MQKLDSNIIMIILLVLTGVFFIFGKLLNIPLSETIFMMGFILSFLVIIVIHGLKTLGARELLIFFLIAYGIVLLYEYGGVMWGELIGVRYYYTDLLGPKFLGKIPYIIPLVWSMSLYCAFTMTNIIFNRIRTNHDSWEQISKQWLLKIIGMGIVTGLIMASWDLINDPVMVAMGAWNWPDGGLYYGISLWNYEGWIEISALIFVLFSFYLYRVKRNQIYIDRDNRSGYTLLVVALYLTILLFYAIYAVDVQVTYVIPWATITMSSAAAITIIQFYRFNSKQK